MKFNPREVRFQSFLQWGTEGKPRSVKSVVLLRIGLWSRTYLLHVVGASQGNWGALELQVERAVRASSGITVAPKPGSSFVSWKQHSFCSLRGGSQAIYLLCNLRQLLGLHEQRLPLLKIARTVSCHGATRFTWGGLRESLPDRVGVQEQSEQGFVGGSEGISHVCFVGHSRYSVSENCSGSLILYLQFLNPEVSEI